VRDTLERAAPVYRKAWWPAHRASNQAWRTSIEHLVAEHGRIILAFITQAYGLHWPVAGFPVHASRYSIWAGAYSSVRGVLVIASSYPANAGLRRLEEIWLPYLAGRGTREEALAALLARTSARP
jgi:hypothetical protein